MVFVVKLTEENVERVRRVVPDWEIIQGKDSDVWLPHLREAEIVIGWNQHVLKECLSQETSLRWVQTWSAGVNTIPIDDLDKRGIILTNASGVHAFPISETIFGMMLAFTRRIHLYIQNQQTNSWAGGPNPLELHGKTIGILGVGAIGQETARLAKAFGMHVLGYRRSGKPAEYVDEMVSVNGLHHLLAESDYVVNALPLTPETHHLIGVEQLRVMKPTAFYVNIGRGETTNTDALLSALRNKEIAGAGLDVFEQEPLLADHPLWDLENVIITPHNAGATAQYTDRVLDIFLPNLLDYLEGKNVRRNRVDFTRQY
jgi:phosphoglycerate dehydrogenase-like enzyme